MSIKIIGVLAALAVVGAVPIGPLLGHPAYGHQTILKAAPLIKTIAYEHEAPAHYDFSYSVHDEHTGDIKSQHESRQGDNVQGSYSLLDADGYQRTVEYTADEHNGFNAVVQRVPVKVPVVHKAIHYAAPKILAPVHYAAAPAYHY